MELAHQPDALLDLGSFQSEREGDPATVESLVPCRGIDAEREDPVRRRLCDLLDVHAALRRRDEADAAGAAIDQQREVHLALDPGTVLDVDAVDLLPGRSGLLGDQRSAQHAAGFVGGLLCGSCDSHAALLPGIRFLERAFPASACMYLGLHDPGRPVQRASRRLRVFRSQDHASVGYRRPRISQQRLCLILVNVQGNPLVMVHSMRFRSRTPIAPHDQQVNLELVKMFQICDH